MSEPPYIQISFWAVAIIYAVFFVVFGLVMNTGITGRIATLLIEGRSHDISPILTGARVVLFMFIFGWLMVSNIMIYKFGMNGNQDAVAAKIAAIVTASVVGVAFILCNDMHFIRIFENTVGYVVLDTIYGMDKKMAEYLQMDTEEATPWMNEVFKLGFLVTAFRLDNFDDACNMFSSGSNTTFYPQLSWKKDKNDKQPLAELVVKKHIIGHLCWIYFSALSATTVACKFLARNT